VYTYITMGELEGWKLCPRCGAELAGDTARLTCGTCGFVVYAGSKPTASALCVANGRVLLARRAHPPFEGFWDIPGGFLNEGEDPLDGLRRELKEETGLEVEPERFLGIWVDRYGGDSTAKATLNLYWTARVVGGEATAADDVSELRWFDRDELPSPSELAFENVPLVLATWRGHRPYGQLI
jgi:ADP-ribose pyrophosphatase YjhB (NUDIX family)